LRAGLRALAARRRDEKAWPRGGKAFTFRGVACGKQTPATAGAILHGSNLTLTVWFWAADLMATHSNGVSALQLQLQSRVSLRNVDLTEAKA
jgi:hypothetical protein